MIDLFKSVIFLKKSFCTAILNEGGGGRGAGSVQRRGKGLLIALF